MNIGIKWEEAGFTDGANIGLAIANFGFLWALIGGGTVPEFPSQKSIIRTRKKYSIHEVKDMELEKNTRRTISIPKSAHIDDFDHSASSHRFGLSATYLLIWGLSAVLASLEFIRRNCFRNAVGIQLCDWNGSSPGSTYFYR